MTINNLQKQLSLLVDNSHLRRLANNLSARGQFRDMRRLQELRDPSVDHGWLYRVDPAE